MPTRPRTAIVLRGLGRYAAAAAVAGGATLVGHLVAHEQDLANLAMVDLAGVVVVALLCGRGPACFAAVLAVAAMDFLFVPPTLTFAVHELRHLWTLAVMLAVGLTIATLVERVRAQAKKAEQAALVAETERMRAALLSSVSHDLRTPLASITGAASALLDGVVGDAAGRRELVQTIHEEADRLNRLVSNLLEMTRIEGGALRVRKEWLPLDEVVGATITRLEHRIGDRRLDLRLPGNLPLVPLDGILFEQVLENLVDNALKHGAPPFEIEARVAAGFLELSVSDRGPGVAPAEAERVFEKFARATPANVGGAGLGLAIVRGIAFAHGGRVACEARPGGGATFRVAVPLGAEPPRVDEEPSSEARA